MSLLPTHRQKTAAFSPWLLAAGFMGLLAGACLLWLPEGTASSLPAHLQAGLQSLHHQLLGLQAQRPWLFGLAFFVLFALLSATALPGCGPLALTAGVCFGPWAGTAMVTAASTLGATASFLLARRLGREALRRRAGERLTALEAALARDGALCLFSLRMAPVIPFGLLNPLMGLTAMPTGQFALVSALGMLAGSAAYVVVGAELGQAATPADLASPALLAGLLALALLPWLWRAAWRRRPGAPGEPGR